MCQASKRQKKRVEVCPPGICRGAIPLWFDEIYWRLEIIGTGESRRASKLSSYMDNIMREA